jgi:iron complex outermembrane recepter protein
VRGTKRRGGAWALALATTLGTAFDVMAISTVHASELAEMSLEDLMNIEVTSVSRKSERSSEAAAALYVVTAEDIRRSGSRTLADALRLVPGVHVAQINANVWAVGVRGFSGQLDNKLQVLIDGRSVYTPLFAGVFWDVQDTMLEDVERIEVIRGPGGTLWGANAVNGVVNVITKSAKQTQGVYLESGGGTEERAFGGFRYGGSVGDDFHYRIWGKAFERDAGYLRGGGAEDDWRVGRMGFRADWTASDVDSVMIQGDLYEGESGSLGGGQGDEDLPDADLSGASLLGRWTRSYASEAESQLQLYYDYNDRNEALVRDRRSTVDLDAQLRQPYRVLGLRQELVFGGGYRLYLDHLRGGPLVDVEPDAREVHLPSGFVQNDTWLAGDRVRVTLGTKVEHTEFTGWELSPSGRVAFLPDDRQTVWASVSRAVRIISRLENDLALESPASPEIPLPTLFLGNRSLGSEELLAYEVGYRIRPADRLLLDVAAFYNDYDELVTFAPEDPRVLPPGRLVLPIVAGNQMDGAIYGFEVAADAALAPWWRVRSSYSHVQVDLHPEPGAQDPFEADGSSPRHMIAVRSFVDLPRDVQLDQMIRWIDAIPGRGVGSYWALDLRLGIPLPRGLELSLVGQNLLDGHHREFDGGTQVQRGFYGKLSWRF